MASESPLPRAPDEVYEDALDRVRELRAACPVVLSDDTIVSATLDFAREGLYRHWAESKVEDVARAMFWGGWPADRELPETSREPFLRYARRVLGLEGEWAEGRPGCDGWAETEEEAPNGE